jgi:hypothetical protein
VVFANPIKEDGLIGGSYEKKTLFAVGNMKR